MSIKAYLLTVVLLAPVFSTLPSLAQDLRQARAAHGGEPAPDIDETLSLLRSGRFVSLDARLNRLQADYERDTAKERFLGTAFSAFALPDPEVEPLLDEWRRQYPASYAANLASGIFYNAMAWAWRGTKYAGKTHPERLSKMQDYLGKAQGLLVRTLKMTATPTVSYAYLINATGTLGDIEAATRWLRAAEAHDPYCETPRDAYMTYLEPRWSGSLADMQAFAGRIRQIDHPKMQKAAQRLAGQVDWYLGHEAHLQRNYVEALDHYNRSLAKSEDANVLHARAQIHQVVGQTGLAMADVNRARELSWNDTALLVTRADIWLDKRMPESALNDLRTAARRGNLDAARKLGYLCFDGHQGIKIDVPEGLRWWNQLAYFRDEYALFAIGKAYERGLGVPADPAKAVRYYRYAAIQGHPETLNDLGLMTWYGRGTPADRDLAVEMWLEAARQGVDFAKHNLRFFLTPGEKLKLVPRYPQILLEDKITAGLALAIALVLLLSAIALNARLRAGSPDSKAIGDGQS